MNKAAIRDYIKDYVPYSQNPAWVEWYLRVAPIKAMRVVKTLKKYKDNKAKLLDCGCGTGLTLYYVSKHFKNSQGVDVNKRNITIAQEQFRKLHHAVPLKLYNGKRLPYPDNFFDIVLSIEVWEHAIDTRTMLKEIARVLKPDGILHITTANKLWPLEPHYRLLFLSYLPTTLADWYVKKMGKARFYHDIHLPTYSEFKRSVEEYFTVSDITFDAIINYKEVGLDKERGRIIVLISVVLRTLKNFEDVFLLSIFARSILILLSTLSLGWLFIAHPQKALAHPNI